MDGEGCFGEEIVDVGHLFQGGHEGVAPREEPVGEGKAYGILQLVLLGEEVADAHGVAARGLQRLQFLPQRSQAWVVAVIDIEVGDASMVGV